ncbi:hypothetical protein Q31a_55370 [Aureliella helgolandensis]|uniref:Uncharacterized protein n=1 Tax=Aureliella helgolandensis TaxID=2527968 RepID=A0A518GF16_9BACT|nr:hypothetical protein Q31a_55370 [Aureliella helgolandensis]
MLAGSEVGRQRAELKVRWVCRSAYGPDLVFQATLGAWLTRLAAGSIKDVFPVTKVCAASAAFVAKRASCCAGRALVRRPVTAAVCRLCKLRELASRRGWLF